MKEWFECRSRIRCDHLSSPPVLHVQILMGGLTVGLVLKNMLERGGVYFMFLASCLPSLRNFQQFLMLEPILE